MTQTAVHLLSDRLVTIKARINNLARWIAESEDPDFRLSLIEEMENLSSYAAHLESWRSVYAGQEN